MRTQTITNGGSNADDPAELLSDAIEMLRQLIADAERGKPPDASELRAVRDVLTELHIS